MITVNQPEDTNTSNILKGFTIFLSVCLKTKIISHSGVIDVVLMNNSYTQEDLNSSVLLGWEQLTDYSWRYYLENPWVRLAGKYENDPQFGEVLDYIAKDRKELDEVEEDLWGKTYSLDFHSPWRTGNNPKDLTEEDNYYDSAYQIVEEKMYDQ